MNANLHSDQQDAQAVPSALLRQLAEAAGLAVEWTDAFGKQQNVSADTLRQVLSALQIDCDDDAACDASIAMLAEEESTLALPPLITAQLDREIELSPLAEVYGETYRIELEGGGELNGRIPDRDGNPPRLPAIDRIGYHRLYIGDRHVLVLAVAPLRCFTVADAVHGSEATPHLWALAAQLYSLRREDGETTGDAGIGDFTALEILARSAAKQGASAIAISPVHAMFSANPYQYSPYGPSSRLFFNVMHIDPATISGDEALRASIERLGLDDERHRLHQADLVDWPAVARWRLAVLRDLFDHYDIHSEGWKEFEAFRIEGGMPLEDHARFEALHAMMREKGIEGSWRDWPQEYRDPRSDEVATFAEVHDNDIMFHAFLQWQAARGLQQAQRSAISAGMRIGLITDLAVGAESAGSQAWSRQHQMLNGLSVGAPPDILGPQGQNWGLAAFSPRALRQYGFQAYIEMLRAAFRYAGGVRIDHILGLTRLWLVPDGSDGRHGVYLRYPFEDLMRLIALESHRYKAIVIGEDLGTVPAGFSERLGDAGLMGIRVLWFEQDNGRFRPAGDWSSHAIATTDTHDLPTVVGWWHSRDIRWRSDLDLLAPGANVDDEYAGRGREREALARALNDMPERNQAAAQVDANNEQAPVGSILQFIGSTPAPLVIVPLEDVLALEEQPNLPNTIDQHPNWRRRLPLPVDTMLDSEIVRERLAVLNEARAQKGQP
ncbi:MAG TPA: 4-alpha-glucanotransferase [Oxalicibacterium sp.]|jgi:4-alpha-glucanotransferase|nr:4-alpha-glucanotransferase [Oxalicibacterium sp.]